jgi:Flp pilus assembly protein TadG
MNIHITEYLLQAGSEKWARLHNMGREKEGQGRWRAKPSAAFSARTARRQRDASVAGRSGKLRLRGQSMVVIALAMVVLLAFVGLAIDGVSAYAQRRDAQNAVDGAALAGVRMMLSKYQDTVYAFHEERDGSADQEDEVALAIETYAAANGILTSTLQAYFVDDYKEIKSAPVAYAPDGSPLCGTLITLSPCTIGNNNLIPFTRGAKGVYVKGSKETDSFIMKLFGWDQVGAKADATAYMGPATSLGNDVGLLPIGFFTTTTEYGNLRPGQTYVLMEGDSRRTSGNWGWVAFNGDGNANVTEAWIKCGYNPTLRNQEEWDRWAEDRCTDNRQQGVHGYGPTEYYVGWPSPTGGAYYDYTIRWGPGPQGWWLKGSTGTTRSNCEDLAQAVRDILRRSPPDFLVPVFDAWTDTGSNTKFHLLDLAWFRITRGEVDCHARDPITRENYQTWRIEGIYLQKYTGGAVGRHGDLLRTSLHTVFLEP